MAKEIFYKDNQMIGYQDDEHPHAEIIFLALFDKYSLKYGHKWYQNDKNKIILFEFEKKIFKGKKEMETFIQENGIIVEHSWVLDHPLAHGLPDTRSLRPRVLRKELNDNYYG